MVTIEYHTSLLDREVTHADIHDGRTARMRALEEFERNEQAREKQSFEACRLSIAPRLYDQELERMKSESCKDTGAWLGKDETFQTWLSSGRKSSAFLWLSGIPGAGQYAFRFILHSCSYYLNFIVFYTLAFGRNSMSNIRGFQAMLSSELLAAWRRSDRLRFTQCILHILLQNFSLKV